MARDFSFDNAAFHFAKADGPKGFLVKFLPVYGLGAMAMMVLQFFMMRPLFEDYLVMAQNLAAGASEAEIEEIMNEAMLANIGSLALGYLVMLVVGLVFWACFEAAIQRRYVREEGFSLRLGGDELRMMVVGLIWFAVLIGGYIASTLAMLGLVMPVVAIMGDSPALVGIWTMIVVIVLLCLWLFVVIRLSAAGALTIRDRRIHFFESWRVTKGRFWPLFGSFVVLYVILAIGGMLIFLVGGGVAFAGIIGQLPALEAAGDDMSVIMGILATPAVLVPALIGLFVMMMAYGFFYYAWAGPPALAAKTDPQGGGRVGAADAFN